MQRAQTHNAPETQDGEDDLCVNDYGDVYESDQRERQLRGYAKETGDSRRPREHLAHDGFLSTKFHRFEVVRIDGLHGIVYSIFIRFFIRLSRQQSSLGGLSRVVRLARERLSFRLAESLRAPLVLELRCVCVRARLEPALENFLHGFAHVCSHRASL